MWLDDFIGWLSPAAGVRRVLARDALVQVRAYEGGKQGRRFSGWKTTGGSANAEAATLPRLRDRSRDLIRNNACAAAWIDKWVSNTIGTGIIAKWHDKRTQKAWNDWVAVADADGQLDFSGLQALAARCMQESGEVLVRLHTRRPEDGLPVPLQIQLLEPDFVDQQKTDDLKDGGYIIQGVEFSAVGKVVAYWLFDRHPGEIGLPLKPLKSRRIPADDLLLVFEKKRAGQVRGIPRLAPVLLKLRDLDDYEDAELMRKKIEACFTAFVTSADPNRALGQNGENRSSGEVLTLRPRSTKVSPGSIERLAPGETVEFGHPTPSGDDGFTRRQQRAVAAVGGVTYEMLTGDLSQVNYSSARVGLLDVRAAAEQWRWLTFVPGFLGPIAKRWLLLAALAGKAKKDAVLEWTTPRWDWVDPVKDAKGELLEIASGLKSWSESVRRRGYDPDTVLEEIAAEREEFARLGISLTFDTAIVPEPPEASPAASGA